MLPLSICLIAKNEEQNISRCLKPLCRLNCEIILTDTGSEDRTLSIAAQYPIQIHHFHWCNDFSAARNFCIAQASNDWILMVDCDEFLKDFCLSDAHAFFSAPSLQEKSMQIGNILRYNTYSSETDSNITTDWTGRFFHKSFFYYQGIIHEQLVSDSIQDIQYYNLPLHFDHVGYTDDSIRLQKAMRNIPLLERELDISHPDPYILYQLGQSFFSVKQYEKAMEYFSQGLSFDLDPRLEYVQTMVESYGYCLLNLKRYKEALQLEGIYDAFCVHADFVFLMGLIYMNNALFQNAIHEFLKATTISAHTTEGVNSYLSYYNIGVIYECLGHTAEAKKFYQKCGAYQPAQCRLDSL